MLLLGTERHRSVPRHGLGWVSDQGLSIHCDDYILSKVNYLYVPTHYEVLLLGIERCHWVPRHSLGGMSEWSQSNIHIYHCEVHMIVSLIACQHWLYHGCQQSGTTARKRMESSWAEGRSKKSLNTYYIIHCKSLPSPWLGPCIIQGFNEFLDALSYDTLFTFLVS